MGLLTLLCFSSVFSVRQRAPQVRSPTTTRRYPYRRTRLLDPVIFADDEKARPSTTGALRAKIRGTLREHDGIMSTGGAHRAPPGHRRMIILEHRRLVPIEHHHLGLSEHPYLRLADIHDLCLVWNQLLGSQPQHQIRLVRFPHR